MGREVATRDPQVPRTEPIGSRPRVREHALALLLYVTAAFALFGVPVVAHPQTSYIGFDDPDPALFMWSLKWWPYALTHGLNPFVTDYFWAPEKVNLVWSTSVPGPALAVAPLTLIAGPVVSYNVLMLTAPALGAWTAYLLCREVTKEFWPSLAGGYLFGFSSYELGHLLNHLHLVMVFVLPLLPLLVLRRISGALPRRRFVLLLAAAFSLQMLISTEVALSAVLVGATALGLAFLFGQAELRRVLRETTGLVLVAGGVAAALLSPLLYYAFFKDVPARPFRPPAENSIDLANFAVPTRITLLGTHVAVGNLAESGAYAGPLLVVLALFTRAEWRTLRGRVILGVLVVSAFAALGPVLHVAHRELFPLPWKVLTYVPLVNSVKPARLTVYAFLAAAVATSVWLAAKAPRRWARWALVGVAVLSLLPAVGQAESWWRTSFRVPGLFADGMVRRFVKPGDVVVVVPYGHCGRSMLWQAQADMSFRMAGGYIGDTPKSFASSHAVAALFSGVKTRAAERELPWFLSSHRVRAVLVADGIPGDWATLFRPLGKPVDVGGMKVYRVPRFRAVAKPRLQPPTNVRPCAGMRPSYGIGL